MDRWRRNEQWQFFQTMRQRRKRSAPCTSQHISYGDTAMSLGLFPKIPHNGASPPASRINGMQKSCRYAPRRKRSRKDYRNAKSVSSSMRASICIRSYLLLRKPLSFLIRTRGITADPEPSRKNALTLYWSIFAAMWSVELLWAVGEWSCDW